MSTAKNIRNLIYGSAVREAIHAEMISDSNVVLMGQDIQSNVYGYTDGLVSIHGSNRVINTPISEAAIIGTAVGSSLFGVIPIVDLTVASFLYISMDQIASIAAKIRYMHNGKHNANITILVWLLHGTSSASQHSDRPFSMIMNLPGVKSVAPASPQDAYSLLRSAIRDPDPVVVFLDRNLFYEEAFVDENMEIPIGIPRHVTAGADITVLSVSGAIRSSMQAVQSVAQRGVEVDLFDIRSLKPLDFTLIKQSIKKTGRLLINDLSCEVCSVADYLASKCLQACFADLKSAPVLFTYPDAHSPFSAHLEKSLFPNPKDIEASILDLVGI